MKRLSADETKREIAYLDAVLAGDQSDKIKRELLVRHAAHELRAYRLIGKLVDHASGVTS